MTKERVIYASEIRRFFLQNRGGLLLTGFLCALVIFLLTLGLSKPHFRANATFRQAKNHTEDSASLQSILQTMGRSYEEASTVSVMQSKRLLNEVIEKTGLQLVPIDENKFKTLLFAELRLAQSSPSVLFRDVHFEQEGSKALFIRSLSGESYEVLDLKKKSLGKGTLNTPFHHEDFTFTLEQKPLQNKIVKCKFMSKRQVCAALQKNLSIKTSRLDSHIIKLSYTHPSRQTALNVLNCLMQQFQQYLQNEHEELSTSQVQYLQKRRDQLGRDFDHALVEHVAYLQDSLGVEGFLGLAQEIEMLSEPKEKYSAKKHELDIERKRWQETRLEASAEHPWKEGMKKIDALQWHQEQFAPDSIALQEFSGISLETAQLLHTEYTRELDQISSQIHSLEAFQKKMLEPDFELGALSQILQDEVSQAIVQKGAELSLQLSDKQNRSEKELKRLGEAVATQKGFLREHMGQKIELLQIKADLIEEKMVHLKQVALGLIEKEKTHVEQKLAEITEKMRDLPEKWRLESQLKLKKELTMQIIEGLTQLSESKVVNHHLFHVESKPLDFADAPLNFQSPHLFLFSGMGGLLGAFFSFLALFIRAAQRGLPMSIEYLSDRNFRFVVDRGDEESIQKMALEIESQEVIAVIGSPYGAKLADLLAKTGRDVLCIELGKEQEPQREKGHDVCWIPTLLYKNLNEKLNNWKKKYECILVQVNGGLDTAEALRCLAIADHFILSLGGEKMQHLTPFERKKILCVLTE